MRWLSTFASSSSTATSSSSSSSSSSPTTLKSSPSTSVSKNTRGTWLFGSGKKSTRARKLRHVVTEDDTSVYEAVAVAPFSRSPSARSYLRSNTSSSVAPQPLPLPELPSPSQLRQKDASDCRLPSPRDTTSAPSCRSQEHEAPIEPVSIVTTGFRMRSVFASQETRKNSEHMEMRSPGTGGCASTTASTRGNNNFSISVPSRSAHSSPFASPTISPKNTSHDDFIPYYYVSPKGSQFWSAPEMPTSEAHPPPAFFDLSALGTDNNATSPHQRSPRQQHITSPLPRLSHDTATARRESIAPLTVHPLPLPPWAGTSLPSPSATFSQPVAMARTESLSMTSQWQKGKLIGRGTFGSVYVASNRETGALCAMKEAEIFSDDPKSAECIKQLEQEINVLSHLKHPNIVQYFGSEIVEDKFYIYLEYVHPGSINKYVREHCGAITESVVRNFTRHILSGLAYLHSKKTIHRDIKGANLLVDSAGVVKLADFGMAKHLTGHSADLSLKGSPYWMAPELMQVVMQKDNSSELAFAIDIWSLGCTIIEMFTGKPPWSEYEGAAAMFKVMKDTPHIPETLSPEGKDFLRLCFKRNPAERPTASMLLEHRFLRNLQQPDISSSSQLHNGISSMDSHSPRGLSENPNTQIGKGKSTAESSIAVPYSLYSSQLL